MVVDKARGVDKSMGVWGEFLIKRFFLHEVYRSIVKNVDEPGEQISEILQIRKGARIKWRRL